MQRGAASRGGLVLSSIILLALLLSLSLVPSNFILRSSRADSIITTMPLGATPTEVAVNPVTNMVYVTDAVAHELWIVDGATSSVVGSIAVAASPMGVAVNPNTNMVYMANYNHGPDYNTLWVISGATDAVVAKIPVGTGPTGVAVDPTTNMVYVADGGYFSNPTTTIGVNKLTVIDGSTNEIVDNIPVGDFPFGVAVNPSTNTIYVSNQENKSISVIDGSTDAVTTTIGVGNRPADIAVNQNTNTIYVANSYSNTVSIIDGSTNSVIGTTNVSNEPVGIGANPVTNRIYVSTGDIIDGATGSVIQSLDVSSIEGVAVNQITSRIYIANSSSLVVINGAVAATSRLTIQTVDTNGNEIPGYYTVLFQGGNVISTGFSPIAFTLTNGGQYAVQVQNYGAYVFDHWTDGSTSQTRTVSITSDTTLVAVYRNLNAPPPTTQSQIKVTTELADGTQVAGLYTAIFQNGNQIQSGFSPYSFIVSNGETFQVAVADYGSYHFSHWSNGSTNRFISVTTGSNTVTDLVAVYSYY